MSTRPPQSRYAVLLLASLPCLQVLRADETWTPTTLHPAGADSSEGTAQTATHQFGSAIYAGSSIAARWTGTAESFANLNLGLLLGASILGADGNLQGGRVVVPAMPVNSEEAVAWSGTATSMVNLHPPTAGSSRINAVAGHQMVGMISVGTFPTFSNHAALWQGSLLGFQDLHPPGATHSEILATNGSLQAGYAIANLTQEAALWQGSVAGVISLHPAGASGSVARSIDSKNQAGEVLFGGISHAALWSGTPASFVDLHPAGATNSVINSTRENRQAGVVVHGGISKAGVWSGTAASFVDLHQFLPPNYSESEAASILKVGTETRVVGKAYDSGASHFVAMLWVLPGPTSQIAGKASIRTRAPSRRLRGTSSNAVAVIVKVGAKPARRTATVNSWSQTVRLSKGRNRITVQAVNSFGDKSRPAVVTVVRA